MGTRRFMGMEEAGRRGKTGGGGGGGGRGVEC